MGRLFSYAFGALVLGAVLSPALRTFTDDSYPLSTYPMFARERSSVCLTRVLAVDAREQSRAVPPVLIASGEITQAQTAVRVAMREDPHRRREFCAQIASRVAGNASFSEATRLEIVSECYRPVAYFLEGPEPQSRRLRTDCEVVH